MEVRSPATLELVGTVAATSPEAVQELVAESRLAGERWAPSSHAERRALLGRVLHVLLDRMDGLAETICAETGKPPLEAYTTELFPALDALAWLGDSAEKVLRPERVRYPQLHLRHKRGWLVYEPRGVVAVISPWNFPLAIPLVQAASAVAAGNAVVVKPAEQTPLSGALVEQVFAEAGAPAGLVRVAQGDGEVGAALVRARGLGHVLFTGSAEVGRLVAAEAGKRLVPATLELGGSDPMIVFADADLDRAVAGALWGSFFNCGQVCSGVERIYVEQPLYEPFVEELTRRARGLEVGRDIGPLISEEQRAKVEEIVDEAVARGAEARTGARRPDRPGWFYEPTVLTGATVREEIFGPVVTVASFGNEGEAIRRANDSAYGLGASVWTRDRERARRVAGRLEAGTVWTNDVAYSFASFQASWGGRKESGFGRTHSKHGLYDLSSVKFVDADSGRVPVPWWFPYDERLVDAFRGVLPVLYGRGTERVGAAWRARRDLVRLGRRYLR